MGAAGRMGRMILNSCGQTPGVEVIGCIESSSSPNLGSNIEVAGKPLIISDDLAAVAEKGAVIIDFTAPEATIKHIGIAQEAGAKIVIGTTGFSEDQLAVIQKASENMAIVLSPNMSLGVNLSFKISEMVAKVLGTDYDVEIVEAHHHHKKDAPSGTALGLAKAVAKGHDVNLSSVANYGREGLVGARPKGEIGIHAVRGGDIVGDHTVLFAGDGERIEIKHMAHSRSTFANGAVKAGVFLSTKSSGFYTMFDVLGL